MPDLIGTQIVCFLMHRLSYLCIYSDSKVAGTKSTMYATLAVNNHEESFIASQMTPRVTAVVNQSSNESVINTNGNDVISN